jgi:hypothetical protein
MRSNAHLKIQTPGNAGYSYVRLEGVKDKPERSEFRVYFPGGSVCVTRTQDGDYWAHLDVNHPNATYYDPLDPAGRLVDGRADYCGRHAEKVAALEDPELYHVALRVQRVETEG